MSKSFRLFAVFETQTWLTRLAKPMSPQSAGLLKKSTGTGLTCGKLGNIHTEKKFVLMLIFLLMLTEKFSQLIEYFHSLDIWHKAKTEKTLHQVS